MGGSAAAAAAAAKRRQEQQEEEEMTKYTEGDLKEGWEFKIVRSAMGAFSNPATLQDLIEEEAHVVVGTKRIHVRNRGVRQIG